MNKVYEVINIPLSQLFLHPNNARFATNISYDDVNFDTDKKAIEKMCSLKNLNLDALLKDVATNGIMPSLLPIVSPHKENNKYIVYDANRRITALKLLVEYKDKINLFDIPDKTKYLIKELSYDGAQSFLCVCSSDNNFINTQLSRIHTDDPGVSQVKWTPQAKDYHLAERGEYSNRYILDRFISLSKHSSSSAIENISAHGWRSQIDRILKIETSRDYFGIKFHTRDGKMTLFYDEAFTIKILSNLVSDMIVKSATSTVQTSGARKEYLAKFRFNNPLLDEHMINPTIVFDAVTGKFEKGETIAVSPTSSSDSDPDAVSDNNTEPSVSPSSVKAHNNSSDNGITTTKKDDQDIPSLQPDPALPKSNKKNKRKSLIESEYAKSEKISDKRVKSIYEELETLNHTTFPNAASALFRSLIDMTIKVYLKKNCPDKIEENNLPKNFKKVVAKLEATETQKQLKNMFPKIYEDIEKIDNNETHTIKKLNLVIHNSNYFATPQDISTIVDNYLPFIHFIWDKINMS
ncbi:hypothetical protein [Eubacterium callanderi]|uniref:hypothetical protein n=1 Tax=Eubacterium callanderi TaxID=53442 RepID=UPI001AA0CF69|nr:hypothetical protein [Eubacterium callanderi]MBO1703572.1 hypothetical protein [Eubacterium callanderi]